MPSLSRPRPPLEFRPIPISPQPLGDANVSHSQPLADSHALPATSSSVPRAAPSSSFRPHEPTPSYPKPTSTLPPYLSLHPNAMTLSPIDGHAADEAKAQSALTEPQIYHTPSYTVQTHFPFYSSAPMYPGAYLPSFASAPLGFDPSLAPFIRPTLVGSFAPLSPFSPFHRPPTTDPPGPTPIQETPRNPYKPPSPPRSNEESFHGKTGASAFRRAALRDAPYPQGLPPIATSHEGAPQ